MQSKQRIETWLTDLSSFTASPGKGVTRLTYSKEDTQARKYIKSVMEEYGLTVREDGLGNVFGRLEGKKKGAPAVMAGSHFDSVPNGGAYDGAAGVAAALEVAALFFEQGIVPEYPLEICALIEEEGSRFGGGLMGSRGMTGHMGGQAFQQLTDKDGITAPEAMRAAGLDPDLPIRRAGDLKAFLELHIEQGPVLEESSIPIGIVEGIVGMAQLEVTVTGQAGHAGTVPMDSRYDALVSAAGIIASLPALAEEEGEGAVITVGRLHVSPNGANVIPERAVFSIDVRSGKPGSVARMLGRIQKLIRSYEKNGIRIGIDESLNVPPKQMSKTIQSLFKKSCQEKGISYMMLQSGAGHDAMIMSDVTEAAMIFVPSRNGLSHCPEEWSDPEHIAYGAEILFEAAKKLTGADEDD